MVKKPVTATSTRTLSTGVALPASTGEGVVHDVSTVDALKLGEHQNDDIAGDLAAAEVTRPVLAVGSVIEPVNPALASEPAITGDAAGDAAIEAAGAGPEFVQPLSVAIDTLRPDTYGQSAFLDAAADELLNTPERSATAVEVGAGDTASPAGPVSMIGVDLAKHDDVSVEYVIFDLTRPPTEEERRNLQLVLDHIQGSIPDPRVPAASTEQILRNVDRTDFAREFPLTAAVLTDWRGSEDHDHPVLRVTAKVAGFRRGGIAHPAEAVDYPVGSLKPHQVEAILAEPQLVAEII